MKWRQRMPAASKCDSCQCGSLTASLLVSVLCSVSKCSDCGGKLKVMHWSVRTQWTCQCLDLAGSKVKYRLMLVSLRASLGKRENFSGLNSKNSFFFFSIIHKMLSVVCHLLEMAGSFIISIFIHTRQFHVRYLIVTCRPVAELQQSILWLPGSQCELE